MISNKSSNLFGNIQINDKHWVLENNIGLLKIYNSSLIDSRCITYLLSLRPVEYFQRSNKFINSLFKEIITDEYIAGVNYYSVLIWAAVDTLYESINDKNELEYITKILTNMAYNIRSRSKSVGSKSIFNSQDILNCIIISIRRLVNIIKNNTKIDYDMWYNVFNYTFLQFIYNQRDNTLLCLNKHKYIPQKHDNYQEAVEKYCKLFGNTMNATILINSIMPLISNTANLKECFMLSNDQLEPLLRLSADCNFDKTEQLSSSIYAFASINQVSICEAREYLVNNINPINMTQICIDNYIKIKSHLGNVEHPIFRKLIDNCLGIALNMMNIGHKLKRDIVTLDIIDILNSFKLGEIRNSLSISYYDTCYLLQSDYIDDKDKKKIVLYLLENQNNNGSWGSCYINNNSDTIINTSKVLLTILEYNKGIKHESILNAVFYLKNTIPLMKNNERLFIGFEIIIYNLLEKLNTYIIFKNLGISINLFEEQIKNRIIQKVKLVEKIGFNNLSTSYCLEAAKSEDIRSVDNNKSLMMTSPSSLFTYLNQVKSNRYIKEIADKLIKTYGLKMPTVSSIDIFETVWSIKYLTLLPKDSISKDKFEPILSQLYNQVSIGKGKSYSTLCSLDEADDTIVTLNALLSFDYPVNLESSLSEFWNECYFKTFVYENVKSVSTNSHCLETINKFLLKTDNQTLINWRDHIVQFLISEQNVDGYWIDKWHISPLYATCESILALSTVNTNDTHLKNKSIDSLTKAKKWILDTQREDGGWTECNCYISTLEETSYAILALLSLVSSKQSEDIIVLAIHKGWGFLKSRINKLNRESKECGLWVSKVLYSPINVVKVLVYVAFILSDIFVFNN